MDTVSSILSTGVELAGIYGLVVLAVVVAFRIANFADLTMDGSFTLGGAVGAVSLLRGSSPVLALAYGGLAGAAAGVFTVLLHTRVGVNRLLAGIITFTILYSLNLRVLKGPNVSILDQASVFSSFPAGIGQVAGTACIALGIALLLWAFLRTDLGYFLRAAGENPRVVQRRGFAVERFLLIALALANALAALAGGLASQQQGFADVGMGTGMVIGSLTGLLLGEAILPPRSLLRMVAAALIGAVTYQIMVGIGLRAGLNPWDLKLATGVLLIGALVLKNRTRLKRNAENIGSDPL